MFRKHLPVFKNSNKLFFTPINIHSTLTPKQTYLSNSWKWNLVMRHFPNNIWQTNYMIKKVVNHCKQLDIDLSKTNYINFTCIHRMYFHDFANLFMKIKEVRPDLMDKPNTIYFLLDHWRFAADFKMVVMEKFVTKTILNRILTSSNAIHYVRLLSYMLSCNLYNAKNLEALLETPYKLSSIKNLIKFVNDNLAVDLDRVTQQKILQHYFDLALTNNKFLNEMDKWIKQYIRPYELVIAGHMFIQEKSFKLPNLKINNTTCLQTLLLQDNIKSMKNKFPFYKMLAATTVASFFLASQYNKSQSTQEANITPRKINAKNR